MRTGKADVVKSGRLWYNGVDMENATDSCGISFIPDI